ncbi:hypothetical protein FF38_10840 [Lucilia cuprina]|uniref:Uncharacterized protein n=1 Tax=Lucilia cuprina TaxID=7375 RepID=A0A0L0BVQ9_LUCCU|nr:hypothetical protein FF38_10840 [Lucilia cuprina]
MSYTGKTDDEVKKKSQRSFSYVNHVEHLLNDPNKKERLMQQLLNRLRAKRCREKRSELETSTTKVIELPELHLYETSTTKVIELPELHL